MLRLCGNSLPKPLNATRSNLWQNRVLVAHLRTWNGPQPNASVIRSPTGTESFQPYKLTTNARLDVASPLTGNSRGPNKGVHPTKYSVQRPSGDKFFAELSYRLANENVSGTTLWYFVRNSLPRLLSDDEDAFTEAQSSLLSRVLHRVLDEYTTQGINPGSVRLRTVLRFYVARNLMRRKDWVYCLEFLARTAYQDINFHRDQPLEDSLDGRISDAISLRLLYNAWTIFLREDGHHDSEPMARAHSIGNLWAGLRYRQAQVHDVENGADYVQHFISSMPKDNDFGDPDLDRRLAYISILSLVALYSSMRTFYVDNVDVSRRKGCSSSSSSSQSDSSAGGEGDSSNVQPNWHLGPGQRTYWAPEIGHLSISEASMLYIIAQAAKGTTPNITLLRISLAQMSLPERDAQEIARIYQGFKLVVPAIMAKFHNFEYDLRVSKFGLLRRYPVRAYLQRAMESNDVEALERAAAIVDSYEGAAKIAPGDSLALFKAFLQMDHPRRALSYWYKLAQHARLGSHTWQIWLDYAFRKNDHIAFENVWHKLRPLSVPRTSKMWYQRLLLLYRNNESSAAWEHFCTLIRFSGKNKKLVGIHVPLIAPSNVDIEIFHIMIKAYLNGKIPEIAADERAKEVLELLQNQEGLLATRDTYMLFIEHFLEEGARQRAIKWYVAGNASDIKFLPKDYALLLEHDLVSHDENKPSPLADFASDTRDCFDAISATMRLARGRRLSAWDSSQTLSSPSDIELVVRNMPLVDTVDDNLQNPKMKEIQSLYSGIMHHLARNFPEQPSGMAKTARLRLLLLLWDHCLAEGIPASTEMESILRSILLGIHPGLQEKLMRGALFNNYDEKDPVAFHNYTFLQYFGRQWFFDRITSLPPGPTKSQVAELPWRGYDALTDRTLTDAGIVSQEDRQSVLDEVTSWKTVALAKRAESLQKKKDRHRQVSLRKLEFKDLTPDEYDRVAEEIRLLGAQLAGEIKAKEETFQRLQKELDVARIKAQSERRAILGELRLCSNDAISRLVGSTP